MIFRRLRAFTVLELLLAVVVMGVIGGFALAKFGSVKERAYVSAMKSDLRNYANAQELYYERQGVYADAPSSLSSFSLTEGVYVVTSSGDGDRWLLRVGHRNTDQTCILEMSSRAVGAITDNKIHCKGSQSVDFGVSNLAPSAGEEVTFDATGAVAEFAYEGGLVRTLVASGPEDVTRVVWDFGDGNRIEGAPASHLIVKHSYATSGTYTVSLTLTKKDGSFGWGSKKISVGAANQPPTAFFTYEPSSPEAGEAILFIATATDPDQDSLSYTWDFGDGEVGSGTIVQKTYGDVGTYAVTLVVTDGRGGEATHTETVNIAPNGILARVVAGDNYTCGLSLQGRAYCWGRNHLGQLGDNTTTQRLVPTPIDSYLRFDFIEAGQDHTCALTPQGVAYCWGSPVSGKLGDGTTTQHLVPTPVAGNLIFDQIAAGNFHTCGVTVQGEAYCWGNNGNGRLGNNGLVETSVPAAVVGNLQFRQVAAGYEHTCGLTIQGVAYCWGGNSYGQLGNNSTTRSLTPTLVAGDLIFSQIDAGSYHTCGVTAQGEMYCWGNNDYGQLGDNTFTARRVPTKVSGNLNFSQIATGTYHTCGLTAQGNAYCWGANSAGQLGDNTKTLRRVPTQVMSGLSFNQITAGNFHTCGFTVQGEAYCWGANSAGQLGDNTTTERVLPTRVQTNANP